MSSKKPNGSNKNKNDVMNYTTPKGFVPGSQLGNALYKPNFGDKSRYSEDAESSRAQMYMDYSKKGPKQAQGDYAGQMRWINMGKGASNKANLARMAALDKLKTGKFIKEPHFKNGKRVPYQLPNGKWTDTEFRPNKFIKE